MNQVTIENNGHDWFLLKVKREDGEIHTFGFESEADAKNARRFAVYCLENDITLEDLNRSL